MSGVLILNLALFIAVASTPAFRAAHHHWIFPLFAAALSLEWAACFALPSGGRVSREAARATIVSTLLFLLIMGVVRHATILACFDRCAFKLAAAAALAAPIFWAHGLLRAPGWWTPKRSSLAALGAAVWALYLGLTALNIGPWIMDMIFAIVALLLWLGRHRADFLLVSVGIMSGIVIRESANEIVRISLGVVWGAALPLAYVERVQAWLDARPKPKSVPARPGRVLAFTAVFALLAFYVTGPVFLMTNREERQKRLASMAPAFPIHDPKTLSPLAARLRGHVVMLSETIGERDAFTPKKQNAARDYVKAQLAAAGYKPKLLPYGSLWLPSIQNGTSFYNVEAVLPVSPAGGPAWIVGAHYDSAPGTPGADDNASAVAVLIEAARLLKLRHPAREIRFVAFGTEEPPSFGTRNMGSAQYAHWARDNGLNVHGMISLETLGYFNPRPGSQFYPPFMHLLYPSHGDYISVAGDIKSRALLGRFARDWRSHSSFPLYKAILPGVFSGLALSDQLNFWDLGFPALILTDTAFYRNPNYHEHTDTPDTLDYEKMARVAEALVQVLDSKP